MSAWVVSKAHIDALVNAAAQFGVIASKGEANAAGRLLWAENVRSVNYRYDEESEPPEYKIQTTEAAFRAAAVLRVLDCYEYQSCECPDWEKSQAFAWCARLRAAALGRLPAEATEQVQDGPFRVQRYTTWPEYKQTPWGIDSLADISPIATKRLGGEFR
jgi:hypothetical protein